MRPAFKRFVIKFRADPQGSWRRFILGLLIFISGLSGLLLNTQPQSAWLDNLCVLVMLIGFGFAMIGYVGIFASRFNRLL